MYGLNLIGFLIFGDICLFCETGRANYTAAERYTGMRSSAVTHTFMYFVTCEPSEYNVFLNPAVPVFPLI